MGGKTTRTSDTKVLEFQVNSATYGLPVPVILGTARISGNVIDWFDFTAIAHTETTRTGKGGGSKTEHTTYTYRAAVLLGLAEGPIDGVGKVWADDTVYNSLSALNLTLFNGAFGQSPWSYTQSKHPAKALPYSGLAYVAGVIDLNSSGGLPQLNFEVKGMLRETGDGIDVNPADAIQFICIDPVNGVGFGVGGIDMDSLERYRTYCKAADLLITVEATETKKAYEIINEICQATNTIVFWSQNKLKLVPRCDERLERNGVVYEPDNTPLYELDERDFLDTGGAALVEFEREDNAEAYNHVPVEFINRANGYEKEIADGEILSDINRRGRRSKSTVNLPYLRTKARAQYVANLLVAASLYGRNKYSFKLGWAHCLLEPGDFVTIYDPVISPNPIPVLIDEIEESEDGDLDVIAIGRKPGANSGARYATHEAERPSIDYNAPPGDAVATIFDLSPEIADGLAACIAVSGGDTWGGCSVWVSDTGEAYQQIGSIDGPSRHGVLTADLPAGAAIDTVNVLQVQMYSGQLLSGTEADAQNLNTLCWVDGELIAYATATLTGEKQYNLSYLIRGAYNTPIAEHPVGSKFVRLDPYLFKYAFTIDQLGKQIYIKLTSRNMFGFVEQELDTVEPIIYTLTAQMPPDVSNIQLIENTYKLQDGTVLTDIKITFDTPTYLRLDRYEVYYNLNDSGWVFAGITTDDNFTIKALKQAQTIRVKTVTVSKDGLKSVGVISDNYMIVGKNTPPGDVKSLTVIQQENILKVTVIPPDDSDINRFELRVGGLSWETSSYLKQFKDNQTTVDVTQAGTQTFWAKAIDNSGNYSDNAVSFVAAIYPISNKFTIHEEHQDGRNWTPKCMFWDRNGWQIDSVEKLGELEYFGQMFDTDYHLCDDAEIVLNIVDLGETITSTNYVETFLSVFAEYDASDKNYLDVDYRTSWDGVNWSEWQPLVNHQFNGRFVQPKLKPRSIDGRTNVNIRGVTVRIDVTAVTETIDFVNVADTGATRIYLNHRFFNEPMPQLFSYASTGKQCTHEIVGNAILKDVDGRWYFDIRLWDGDTQIAGKIGGTAKGY